MTVQSKRLGRMYSERVRAILERVESLEHLSNQHDILLTAVLHILEKDMEKSTDSKSTTCIGGVDT